MSHTTTTNDDGYSSESLRTHEPITNSSFLSSSHGRSIRVLAEFEEFPQRMSQIGIRGTFLFFGSARTKYGEGYSSEISTVSCAIEEAERGASSTNSNKDLPKLKAQLASLRRLEWGQQWMVKTEQLSSLLTRWAMSDEGRHVGMVCSSHLIPHNTTTTSTTGTISSANQSHKFIELSSSRPPPIRAGTTATRADDDGDHRPYDYTIHYDQPLVTCTGGGPGFMEAANKGAYLAGGVSMGVGITLPFETSLNRYVTPGLNFQTSFFFSRKYWETFSAKAIICCPGGFGTCDEVYEVLTLIQTGHCPSMPVVFLDKHFWQRAIPLEFFAELGMISSAIMREVYFTDSVEEAFNFITNFLRDETMTSESRNGSKADR